MFPAPSNTYEVITPPKFEVSSREAASDVIVIGALPSASMGQEESNVEPEMALRE
jgi:hypothetical protein